MNKLSCARKYICNHIQIPVVISVFVAGCADAGVRVGVLRYRRNRAQKLSLLQEIITAIL